MQNNTPDHAYAEKRLIIADEALRMLKNCRSDNPYFKGKTRPIWETALDCAISCVDACNTVDAVEVMHGQWVFSGYTEFNGAGYYHCSVCNGEDTTNRTPYCPNCGAKMDVIGNCIGGAD